MHSSDPPGLVIELLGTSHRPRSPPDGAQLPSFDRRPVIRRRPRARAPLQTLELGRYVIESGGETAADRIMAAMLATAMGAAMRPYSIAVAPRLLFIKVSEDRKHSASSLVIDDSLSRLNSYLTVKIPRGRCVSPSEL